MAVTNDLIYELACYDHTHLGSRMGREHVDLLKSWLCSSLALAKMQAEADHHRRITHQRSRPIRWSENGKDSWTSEDLLSHGYTITRRIVLRELE